MSVQTKYDKLVKRWGRELANEIMLKGAQSLPSKKRSGARKGSPVLPGSFESSRKCREKRV